MKKFILEEAINQNGAFIGLRITIADKQYLVFNDQDGMGGIRVGEKFIPEIGEAVFYKTAYTKWLVVNTK